MKNRLPLVVVCLCVGGTLALVWWSSSRGARASGALRQDVYVWQRTWAGELSDAVSTRAGQFGCVVALSAEVSWERAQPRVARVEVDYDCLRRLVVPAGLALRIGPYAGPFADSGEPIEMLSALARERVDEAAANGVGVAELQIDFDCAESKLDGYCQWVRAIRQRIAPTPIVITVLPSWLDRPAFRGLAGAADGFVLQVHSLERPRGPDEPMTLCNVSAARRAVELAANAGSPFRVALATYGYVVAFDSRGRLIGLAAEGPAFSWPSEAQLRVVRSDPSAMAQLVRDWTADRPANMQGLIWYRMPTDGDALNWRWPTLVSVTAGRTPQARVQAAVRRPERGLVEVDLVNNGDADGHVPAEVHLSWVSGRLVAADALKGFELERPGGGSVRFHARQGVGIECLAVGERRTIGWLRFDVDTEVELDIARADP